MKATIETGFRKGKKLMNRSPLRALLCCALVFGVSTGCGDVSRNLVINNGGDISAADTQICGAAPCATPCDFAGLGHIFSISAFLEDFNVNNLVFGADTILDIQSLPVGTQLVGNAKVYIVGNGDVAYAYSSGGSFATAMDATAGDGFGELKTGSDGLAVVTVSYPNIPAFNSMSEGGEATVQIEFFPTVGGDGFSFEMTATCESS